MAAACSFHCMHCCSSLSSGTSNCSLVSIYKSTLKKSKICVNEVSHQKSWLRKFWILPITFERIRRIPEESFLTRITIISSGNDIELDPSIHGDRLEHPGLDARAQTCQTSSDPKWVLTSFIIIMQLDQLPISYLTIIYRDSIPSTFCRFCHFISISTSVILILPFVHLPASILSSLLPSSFISTTILFLLSYYFHTDEIFSISAQCFSSNSLWG